MKPLSRLLALLAGLAACALPVAASPVISELMASNRAALADADGEFSDWLEIHNPDTEAVDLAGWYLTDNASRKTKWQFPAVTIPAGGYLVVFASEKDRRDPDAELHTNFALSADGEYLALIQPDGASVAFEYAPAFPALSADVTYGLVEGVAGFLGAPTPGAANTGGAPATVTLASGAGTEQFTTPMPIVVLDNEGAGAQEAGGDAKEGSFELFAPGHAAGRPIVDTFAGIKLRGSSSAEFPKKSYSVELHDETGRNLSVALLGMAKAADWALVAPWKFDPSYLRNSFAYALSASIGRWAPRTRFVEMFFNDNAAPLAWPHYTGIGVLTERIKIGSDLVNIRSLSADAEDITGGYILKIDPIDADEFGWTTDYGIPDAAPDAERKLIVASAKADKLTPEQRDYIQGYVQAFENALFADRESEWATRDYLDYIDRASWVDYHLLQVFSKNPDGLERSAYFHKDRGGKLKAGPLWDFDRAFGSVDMRSTEWNEWFEPSDGTNLWEAGWWGVLRRDPDFMQAWIDRWQALRHGSLASAKLTALLEKLAGQIDPAAAARDVVRWPDDAVRFATHREEIDHLANWIQSRAEWIDGQFVAAPVLTVDEAGGRTLSAPEGAAIVYTLDGSDPRASGGGFSAAAVTTDSPWTIPADASVVARSYNPEAAREIGSAWSSAAFSPR